MVLVFKTNILYSNDQRKVEELLRGIPHITRLNIDREDVDKVLRIETPDLEPTDELGQARLIIETVTEAGYHCEELTS